MHFPFYFPLGIMLLDDDQQILDNTAQTFSYMFPGRNFYKMVSSLKAIEFCQTRLLNFSALPINFEFNSTEGQGNVTFPTGLSSIAALDRHSQSVGIVILDYAMPEMSGLAFAKSIAHHPTPKILLTGQATNAEALLAFNEGLIDRYVGKDQRDALTMLQTYILDLEARYFTEINDRFRALIGENTLAFLSDPTTCAALRDECERVKARIVVPSFSPPGLLMQTEANELFLFVVIDDDVMEAQIEIALIEEIAPPMIEAMSARTHIYITDLPQAAKASGHSDNFFPISPLAANTYLSKIEILRQ